MNTAKTAFLMVALMGLFIVIGYLLGGEHGMVVAFALASVMNLFAYWFSDKIVLAIYRAQEVNDAAAPGLCAIVRRLAQRAGLPMPRVYVIPQAAPNAFATGRNPRHAAVAVTHGLLQSLDEEELEGVLAHELSHVRNRDILIATIAATLAGAIMMLARMAQFGAIFGGGDRDRRDAAGLGVVFALVFSILAAVAAVLIQMAISRSREYQADASAASLSQNPRGLARALSDLQRAASRIPLEASPATSHMFIVNPFSAQGIIRLFSTHPPIEDRIRRLEEIGEAR